MIYKNLNDKRLLAFYKSRRKSMILFLNTHEYLCPLELQRGSLYDREKKEKIERQAELDSIKLELNTRGHVTKKA